MILDQTKDFYQSLADRWSFSLDIGNATSPVFIYELKDEKHAKTYMDEVFLEKLRHIEAYPGQSIMHNRIEINSYVFPNFKADIPDAPPNASDLEAPKWHWYYAFTDGQLLFTTGTSPESMQIVLDRRAGSEAKFADHPSYQQLVGSLGTDHNVFLAVSPIIGAKTVSLPPMEGVAPNEAAIFQLFSGLFTTMPDNYSVGLAAKARDSGIDANLYINLADFKQLGQIFLMMGRMMQMQ